MSKEALIAQMEASAGDLPWGTMGGGTRRAAAVFIDQMRVLNEAEIRAVVALRKDASTGDFRDWLGSLPV